MYVMHTASLHIVEVKYCTETFHNYVESRARQQHADLIAALRSAGWRHVHMHVIPFGYFGGIPISLNTTLITLGIPRMRIRALARSLHVDAIASSRSYIARFNDIARSGDQRTLRPP